MRIEKDNIVIRSAILKMRKFSTIGGMTEVLWNMPAFLMDWDRAWKKQ